MGDDGGSEGGSVPLMVLHHHDCHDRVTLLVASESRRPRAQSWSAGGNIPMSAAPCPHVGCMPLEQMFVVFRPTARQSRKTRAKTVSFTSLMIALSRRESLRLTYERSAKKIRKNFQNPRDPPQRRRDPALRPSETFRRWRDAPAHRPSYQFHRRCRGPCQLGLDHVPGESSVAA